jgi:thiamine pyrophosphokinase
MQLVHLSPSLAEGVLLTDRRAILFVNGEIAEPGFLTTVCRQDDTLIAVDGGYRHLEHLGMIPHILIGDLDSTPADVLERYQQEKVRILRYPVEKDETDLELGLRLAAAEGYTEILLVGALGGRLDQTLANLFLMGMPLLADRLVKLVDANLEVVLIRERYEIHGQAGDGVSLLPLHGPARGVSTEGLYYPLEGEVLHPENSRGISNTMLAERAVVTLTEGVLVCIHTWLR